MKTSDLKIMGSSPLLPNRKCNKNHNAYQQGYHSNECRLRALGNSPNNLCRRVFAIVIDWIVFLRICQNGLSTGKNDCRVCSGAMRGNRLTGGKFLQRANMLSFFWRVVENLVWGESDPNMRDETASFRTGQHIASANICDFFHKIISFSSDDSARGQGQ